MNLQGVSDAELEDALRRKRANQLQGISDAELEAALARKRQAAPEPSMVSRALGAFRGNAAEEAPGLLSGFTAKPMGFVGMPGIAYDVPNSVEAAAAFGSDEDMANAYLRAYPDATLTEDANGNPMIEHAGKRLYVNKPGLDTSDALRLGAKALSFLPGGRLAGTAGTLAGRVGLGAAAAGTTDVGMQVAAGRSSVDPIQTGITAGLGGATELLAPAIGAGYRAVRDYFRSPAATTKAGQQIASRAGLAVDDDAARFLAAQEAQVQAGAKPRALLAERDFGYQLTRGQRTGDEAMLRKEELLRHTNPNGKLAQQEKFNIAQTVRNVDQMRTQAARGGTPEAYEQDAAQRVRESLQSAQGAERGAMREAYQAVPSKSAYAATGDVQALPQRLAKTLRTSDVILTDPLTPNTIAAQRLITQVVEDAGPAAVRMDRLIELRKALGRMQGSAVKEDSRAFGVLKGEFDTWFDESLTRNLMEGGEDAVKTFKDANKVASRYFSRFEDTKSEPGKAIVKMLVDDATPEQVANVMLNANGINKPGAAAIAKRYISAVGKDSDGVTALREIIARRIFEKAGDPKGHQALVSSLKDALAGRGRSLMQTVYTKSELAQMKRFADTMEEFFVPKGMLGRSSGTAERLAAFAGVLNRLPFGQTVKAVRDDFADRAALRPLLSSRPAAIPAFGAAAAQSEAERRKRRR